MRDVLEALAAALRRGEEPPGVRTLKRNRVRCIALAGPHLLKVWLTPRGEAERERAALERAAARGLPVSQVAGDGPGWLALRFAAGREATREDLPALLELGARMHDAGMLHGDFHLGNLRITDSGPLLLDLQRARFLPRVPRWMRRRELGFLAFSLGDPLPESLFPVRRWRTLRAQRHWRSRTRRCLEESSKFTRFTLDGAAGFRRRAVPVEPLLSALREVAHKEPVKRLPRSSLWRHAGLWLKLHRTSRQARAAWVGGCGLEARGIEIGRPLCFAGRWLVMEDAGQTLIDWVEREFECASQPVREGLADALGGLLARLHARGIYHADLKANNVCWTPGAPARLLDYGRVRFLWRVSRRRRVKNLAQLNAALPDLVPNPLRERALVRYLESVAEPDPERLRRDVVRLSLRRRHRWAGG
jgi:tRNA A-37 threonylcarbamoyl transferase component Bud32